MKIPSAVVHWQEPSTNRIRQIWLIGDKLHVESLKRVLGTIILEKEVSLEEDDILSMPIEEYIELIKGEPTTILLDYDFASEDGEMVNTFSVIRAIREHPLGIFPIVLTSFHDEDAIMKSSLESLWLKSQGCFFLPKPFRLIELKDYLKKPSISPEEQEQICRQYSTMGELLQNAYNNIKSQEDLQQFRGLLLNSALSPYFTDEARQVLERFADFAEKTQSFYDFEKQKDEAIIQWQRQKVGHTIDSMLRGAAAVLRGATERRFSRINQIPLPDVATLLGILEARSEKPEDTQLRLKQDEITQKLRQSWLEKLNWTHKLLFVDDQHEDSGWGIVLQCIFVVEGWHVTCLPHSGDSWGQLSTYEIKREVLETIREDPNWVAILLDLQLDINKEDGGLDILKAIYEEEQRFEIPVIMFTAHNDARLERRCLRRGAMDYYVKESQEGKPVEKYRFLRDLVASAIIEMSSFAPLWQRIRAIEVPESAEDDLKKLLEEIRNDLRRAYFFLTSDARNPRQKLLGGKGSYPEAIINVALMLERLVRFLFTEEEEKINDRDLSGVYADQKIYEKAVALSHIGVFSSEAADFIGITMNVRGKLYVHVESEEYKKAEPYLLQLRKREINIPYYDLSNFRLFLSAGILEAGVCVVESWLKTRQI